jgi:ATP-dependent RNA helicase DHX37/DHR1
LEYLGAVDKNRRITPIGRFMSAFPLHPRYAKMIILGQQFDNMPYIIAIVAGLSVGDPFIRLEELEESGSEDAERSEKLRITRRKFEESRAQYSGMDPGCDVIMLLCAIGAYEYAGATDAYCEQNFLRSKTMKEIRKLRIQITSIVNNQLEGIVAAVDFKANLEPPSSLQIKTIKQTVTAAYLDHIAIRIDLLDPSTPKRHGSRNILRAEYSPITSPGGADAEAHTAFIHPNSALSNISTPPEYIVYSDIRESPATGRLRLLPLTTVAAREIEPLAKGTPLIQYSKPLLYPPPRLLSENGVMKKEVHVVPRFGIHGRGWQLPTIKRVET